MTLALRAVVIIVSIGVRVSSEKKFQYRTYCVPKRSHRHPGASKVQASHRQVQHPQVLEQAPKNRAIDYIQENPVGDCVLETRDLVLVRDDEEDARPEEEQVDGETELYERVRSRGR